MENTLYQLANWLTLSKYYLKIKINQRPTSIVVIVITILRFSPHCLDHYTMIKAFITKNQL